MVSNIPVAKAVSVLKTNDEAKDSILFTTQIAVKQIQHYSSLHSPNDALSMDIREVHQLCDSLDKALFHGLRQYHQGYWPFVKEFTHSNTVSFLEKLGNAHTEIEFGRAWLCLALNENSLESYFRSFQQNPYVVQKHYFTSALLRDDQRMQLVLMLTAGLEYVPIDLNIEKVNLGSGLSFFGSYTDFYRDFDRTSSSSSSDFSQCNSVSPLSLTSLQDDDSGVIGCESAVELTDDHNILQDYANLCKENSHREIKFSHCNLSIQELERITRYINLTSENEMASNEDLEVIRTKVVRRLKKSTSRKTSPEPEAKVKCSEDKNCQENFQSLGNSNDFIENRLSKATTDSGLSLEMHSSSDSESPDLGDELNQKTLSFEVNNFQCDLNVTFSTPRRKCNDPSFDMEVVPDKEVLLPDADNILLVEERGVPEGQEDPIKNPCSSQNSSDRQPLLPGNDGLEEGEEEISIYDVSNISYFTNNSDNILPTVDNCGVIDLTACEDQLDTLDNPAKDKPKTKVRDPVDDEIALAFLTQTSDLDFRLDNSTLLYLLVEVYELEEENCHKMFYGYLNFTKERSQMVLFLLTNKCVYVLKPGNSEQKFIKCDTLMYNNIDYITISLNYQGFTIVCKNYKQMLTLHTADEHLTRSIVSNLEVAIRRFSPKLPLPAVVSDASLQSTILKKFLAAEMNCEKTSVELHHFVHARWGDYDGSSSPPITPTGPRRQGFLMYRHKFCKDNNCTPWGPGYFILKGGVLYCMEDEENTKPLFFVQLCVPHCKGCRRIHLQNRPHAFELILSNGDSLQLGGADDYESSVWQQSFLQTVSLAGHFIDTEGQRLCPCCVLVFNDQIVTACEVSNGSMQLLRKGNIYDLVTIFVDDAVATCVIIEFEMAEASNGSNEWIIFFDSEIEKEKFLEVIHRRWSHMFQVDLQFAPIKDLSLHKKCRQIAQELAAEKEMLQELCYES